MALAPAAQAAVPRGGLVFSQFELEGTHGYTIEGGELREGDFPPTAAIAAHRGRLRASYEVPAELEPGIHAVFGSVGHADLNFQRKKRTVDRPERSCTSITETGTFHGAFSFAGENGYTAAAASSLPGEITRLPNGFCGFGGDRKSVPTPDFLRATRVTARARIANGRVAFGALALDVDSTVDFLATLREAVGPMTILRTASARGASAAFTLGPGDRPRNASVNPPAPFKGSAQLRQRPGRRPTWTGSLSVSFPGAPEVALAGPGFAAALCLDSTLLANCKVALPKVNAR